MTDSAEASNGGAQAEMLAKVDAVRAVHLGREGKGRLEGKVAIVTGAGSKKGMG